MSELRTEITIYIMQNFRNAMSKAWNKRHQNWNVVSKLTGHGSGSSYRLCESLNVDPDGYEFIEVKP
jgi:hypothetical protein